jgi:hypothetical protein
MDLVALPWGSDIARDLGQKHDRTSRLYKITHVQNYRYTCLSASVGLRSPPPFPSVAFCRYQIPWGRGEGEGLSVFPSLIEVYGSKYLPIKIDATAFSVQ